MEGSLFPAVLWAQSNEKVFLTFNVECKNPTIKIEKDNVTFEGVASLDGKKYFVDIQLFDQISPDDCQKQNLGRRIEVTLVKENTDAEFWPSLTKDKIKRHWLKVDFERMQDGSGSDDDTINGKQIINAPSSIEDMMRNMGGGGGGVNNDKDMAFDDIAPDSDVDSDDDAIPD